MKINENLLILYLIVGLALRPVYKYCEHMLDFPRINFTFIFLIIFVLIVCVNIYFFDHSLIEGHLVSFLLLLMVSIIQVISFPWAVEYSSNGTHVYLTTISRTIVQYWLYWFVGVYIVQIFNNQLFWKLMNYLWLVTAVVVILNSLSNTIFAIILGGINIYIMLADSFAVLSIFVLCKSKNIKFQSFIIIISSICLFALWSRASLYCFVLVALYFLYQKNKKILITFICIMVSLVIFNVEEDVQTYRMTRLLFGTADLSNSMRDEQLEMGLQDLSEIWMLGRFMGDVDKNFGHEGDYIHNYLSFWRQFGLLPFVIFCYLVLSNSLKIFIIFGIKLKIMK